MELKGALAQIHKSPELPGFFVIALVGSEAPYFCAQFLQQISLRVGALTYFDTELRTLEETKAELEISFLGMRKLYVLSNLSQLDAATKKEWHTYLQNYQGPHGVLFVDTQGSGRSKSAKSSPKGWKESETHLVIELPDDIDKQLYKELCTFFYPSLVPDSTFMQCLFTQPLSLDDGCRMMAYQMVVGRQCTEFFSEWYPRIVLNEASLFTLSQYFFSRNPPLFLRQWKACKDSFPVEFWIAYWSQQLWQATQYVTSKTASTLGGEMQSYRLPFSFIKSDWRNYSVQVLVEAHNHLYELDFSHKNGGGSFGLELWYHDFLARRR